MIRRNAVGKRPQSVRVIAGKWRGSRLPCIDHPDLRPTPDRVRETLFNWLAPMIVGSACLDCFAGTGALGFEALSRGAARVVMLERDPQAIAQLQTIQHKLSADDATIIQTQVPTRLDPRHCPFDIVFLDPPFQQPTLLAATIEWLEAQALLSEQAYIYIEVPRKLKLLPLPPHWNVLRSKTAGQVGYHLVCNYTAMVRGD